jgi:two-component system chemotaxis response regulator CheB
MTIRVLVVDDSAAIRNIIGAIVAEQPDMTLAGSAPDALTALEMIRTADPDVITLDVEMPGMNGLAFLRRLMRVRPLPVVMLSSHTKEGSDIAFRALALGAVDFVAKPSAGKPVDADYVSSIAQAIRAAHAARASVKRLGSNRLIVIGASTGGAEAIRDVLRGLPAGVPPLLIALQMPVAFVRHFAKRLTETCQVEVREARDGEPALPGTAYVAPAGRHIRLSSQGERGFGIAVSDAAHSSRSAADVLFHSAAEIAGAAAIGVIMTGAGSDGAEGLLAMRERGAFTVAQDEASSAVFGMPRAAIECGAAVAVAPLAEIARVIVARLAGMP